jgi:hypothetical protein
MPNGTFEPKPDTGAIFMQRQANEKQPALKGTLTLSQDLVGELVQALNEGRPPTLEIAGWVKESRRGETYWSLKVGLPYERQGQAAQPRPPAQHGSNGPGLRRPPAPAPAAGHRPPFQGVPPWLTRDNPQQTQAWVADDNDPLWVKK